MHDLTSSLSLNLFICSFSNYTHKQTNTSTLRAYLLKFIIFIVNLKCPELITLVSSLLQNKMLEGAIFLDCGTDLRSGHLVPGEQHHSAQHNQITCKFTSKLICTVSFLIIILIFLLMISNTIKYCSFLGPAYNILSSMTIILEET